MTVCPAAAVTVDDDRLRIRKPEPTRFGRSFAPSAERRP
jgi:hypothetical protein